MSSSNIQARAELWEQNNFCKDANGQARFPAYPLGASELDQHVTKRWTLEAMISDCERANSSLRMGSRWGRACSNLPASVFVEFK